MHVIQLYTIGTTAETFHGDTSLIAQIVMKENNGASCVEHLKSYN